VLCEEELQLEDIKIEGVNLFQWEKKGDRVIAPQKGERSL